MAAGVGPGRDGWAHLDRALYGGDVVLVERERAGTRTSVDTQNRP